MWVKSVSVLFHAYNLCVFRYRIGPFEVESALIEHPAVAESAVVSSPDHTRGEVRYNFNNPNAEATFVQSTRTQRCLKTS